MFWKLDLFSFSGEERKTPTHLKTGTDPVSKTLFSSYLEFRTTGKVQKLSDSEHHTPSSGIFLLASDDGTMN
jgi:hypothetical protein